MSKKIALLSALTLFVPLVLSACGSSEAPALVQAMYVNPMIKSCETKGPSIAVCSTLSNMYMSCLLEGTPGRPVLTAEAACSTQIGTQFYLTLTLTPATSVVRPSSTAAPTFTPPATETAMPTAISTPTIAPPRPAPTNHGRSP